jgi:hypothetical protein
MTAVVFLSLSGGCDPSLTVRGVVETDDSRPIHGATVLLRCEQGRQFERRTTTDVDGRFDFDLGPGCLAQSCTLEAVSGGRASQPSEVAAFCKETLPGCGQECSVVDARLVVGK